MATRIFLPPKGVALIIWLHFQNRMGMTVILVLGPILAAAQREQLSEDSFTMDADGGQKYHDEGETGSQNSVQCL